MWTFNSVEPDSEWWIVGVVAVAAVLFAFRNPNAKWMVLFFLILMDYLAYLDGVSLWWVLGIPTGFVAMGILYFYRNDIQRSGSLLYQRTQKRSPLLPSHRPPYTQRTPVIPPPAKIQPRTAPQFIPRDVPVISTISPPRRQQESAATTSTRSANKIPERSSRPKIDGAALHIAVTEVTEDLYKYDPQIEESTSRTKKCKVYGVFKCYSQTCVRQEKNQVKPRTWHSSKIIVRIWMSEGRRYRTSIYSQNCMDCKTTVEPEVDRDHYVTKVVKSLNGWSGHRSPVKPLQKRPKSGPHIRDECQACIIGDCF